MSVALESQTHQKDLDQFAAMVSAYRQKMKMNRRQRPQRKQRKRHPERIPRPINCFLAYRLDMQKVIIERCPDANHRDISKLVAKWWREEPEHVKEKYRMMAEIAKQEHLQMYPNYKYAPRRRRAGTSSSMQRSHHHQHTVKQESETSSSPDSLVFAASEPYDNTTLSLGYDNASWEAAVMAGCWPTASIMQDCTTMVPVLHAPYYLSLDPQQPSTVSSVPESSNVATPTAALHQCWSQPTPSTFTSTATSSSCSILSHHQQQYQHENRIIMDDGNNIMPPSLLVTEPNSLSYNDMFLEDSPNDYVW